MSDKPLSKDIRVWALLLASMLTVMSGTLITPSLPAIQDHFADVDQVRRLIPLLLTLPALFIVINSPIAGWCSDRFGRRPVLLVGAVLYAVAGSSGLWLDTLDGLLIGRAVLGVAVAGVMTSITTLISDYFEGETRIRMLGLQASWMGLGGAVFLLLGGEAAELHWRGPFAVYLIAVLLLPVIWRFLPEPPRTHGHIAEAHEAPYASIKAPVALIYAAVFCVQVVFYVVPVYLPFTLRSRFAVEGLGTGMAMACITLAFATGANFCAPLVRRWRRRRVAPAGMALVALGYAVVGLSPALWMLPLGLLLAGFGLGLIMPMLSASLAELSPSRLRGRLFGGFSAALFLGQFASPLVSQPLADSFSARWLFVMVGAAVAALGLVVIVLLRLTRGLLNNAESSAAQHGD